ncbi:MAG: response regulator transcription factor [Actinomycetia bacterium]|nr:response regulator transcription factor [Actinomycetes bacterium]
MTSRRILIVDDEPELRSMLRQYLTREGFKVAEAISGNEALDMIDRTHPDLVLLDVGLPDIDGFEVLRTLRSDSDVPVIMLTARDEEIDRVVGLSVGADDYVVKPFSPRELVARIQAVLRRGSPAGRSTDDTLRFAGLTIDESSREVLSNGEPVELSALEFDLLLALAQGPNRVFTRHQLLERVWGWDYFGVERVVDVHVGNIRKVLGDDASNPTYIATVRGIGYKFIGSPE